ncbi:MAG: MFS transporter [Anaerolineae bacterium]|nr:MFS transporter [Anaerolineae bacterium]
MASDKPSLSPPRLAAFQYRDFRLLWSGQLVSIIGSQMQVTAIDWHIYELLKGNIYTIALFDKAFTLQADAIGLGMLGAVRLVPVLLLALVGGMLADTIDRRRMLIWTSVLSAIFASILAVVTLAGQASVAILYLLTSILSGVNAFGNPARQSIVPNLVPREHLTNAVSLNNVMWQTATIIGPSLAGLVWHVFEPGWVYAIDALSFVAPILALLAMSYRGAGASGGVGLGWSSLVEGIRFTYQSRLIWSTMLLDFFATFFASARTMLPLVAGNILGVGALGFGVLSTAQSVGAMLTAVILSLRKTIRRQGIVLLASVAVYGIATALFGLSTFFALSYVLFALTGAGDTVSTVIRASLRQLVTPDHLRGRMTGVNMIFFQGGPQLGEMEAGLVASAFGSPVAIFTGGLATVLLTTWVAWKYPSLRNYTVNEDGEAQTSYA